MNLRTFLPVSSTPQQPRPASAEPPIPLWRRGVALGLAVLLVPFASVGVFAQAGYPAPQTAPQSQQDYPPPPPDLPQGQAYGQQSAQPGSQQPQQDYPPPPPDSGQPQAAQPYQQPYPQQQPQYQQAPLPDPYSQQPYPDQATNQAPYEQPYAAPQQTQPALSPDQLDQLVAPIALYPDGLIAEILAASTFPDQVAAADHWRRSMGYAAPQEIAAGANAQPWDPSVKSLTAFPQVLSEMNQNLSWTTELGNAYYNQPQDVFAAIQAMRQRAEASGNLQSTPQEAVTNDQGYIDIAPVNPQVVYVPAYDPWVVYGGPINPWPGFSLLAGLGYFGVRFGPGLVMSAFTAMPWGWLGWGLSWLGSCLFFDHGGYYPHGPGLRDWGLRYGGPRAPWARNFAYARAYDHGFARGVNRGYDRGFDRGGYAARGYDRGNYTRGFDGRGAYGFSGNRGSYAVNRGYENRGYQNRGYENRGYADPRGGFASRPGYGNYRAPQQGWNREPALNARGGYEARGGYGGYGRTSPGYGSSFYGRTPSFSAPSYRTAPSYRPSAPGGGNRGFSNSYRQPAFRSPSMPSYRAYGGASGFGNRSFQSRSFSAPRNESRSFGGGHSFFGGGHESAPHFSSHSFGGGSHFGGGGHSFGGGHSGGHGSGGHGGGGHHR